MSRKRKAPDSKEPQKKAAKLRMSRSQSKQITREKLLAAARALFSAKGYQEATLREVAKHAGVSVGSVFTTFESKEDVLFAIAAEGYEALAEAIDTEASGPLSAREKLKRGFRAAYAHEVDRHALLMAQIGASWTWSHAFEAKSQERLAKPFGFIGRLVQEAAARGEVRADVDLATLADMLLSAYLRNYRHAWYRGLSAAHMADMGERQIDILFDGAAPRPSGA